MVRRKAICYLCLILCWPFYGDCAERQGIRPVPVIKSDFAAFECRHSLDAEHSDLLSKVQQRYVQIRSIKARFLQDSYLAALDQSEISSGVMQFLKPGHMRWDYETPEAQVFLVKDRVVWLYQPELNQVIIQEFEKILLSNLPVLFLMGLADLGEQFSLKKACRTAEGIIMELQPRSTVKGGEDGLQTFHLLVDEASFIPLGGRVVDVGGNVTSILLRSVEVNPKQVGQGVFALELPPGTDISDQRQEVWQEL